MGRHGRRVSDDGRATALSRQCKRTREQLTLWRGSRHVWDEQRDDMGLTAAYWNARHHSGRPLRPFAIVQVIPPEVFRTAVAARMAGVVALCLVLKHFEVIVWTYADWAKYLDCCERTAGTAARELAAKGWIEIRPHFAEFDLQGRQRHAQLPSTFAPGSLMRLAFNAWKAQGQRAKEQWIRPGAHTVGASASPNTCQPRRDPSLYLDPLFPDVSYGAAGYPQATRASRGSGALFPPTETLLGHRAMEAMAREGGEGVREWAEIIALTLQDALRQAFPAPPPPRGLPKTPRRNRKPDLVRWRPWIRKRCEWRSRDERRREEISRQLRLIQLREWGLDPDGAIPIGAPAEQLRVWYGHPSHCLCAVCFAARAARVDAAPKPAPTLALAPNSSAPSAAHAPRCTCAVCFAARVSGVSAKPRAHAPSCTCAACFAARVPV